MGGGSSKQKQQHSEENFDEAKAQVRRVSMEQAVSEQEAAALIMKAESEDKKQMGLLRSNSETRPQFAIDLKELPSKDQDDEVEETAKREVVFQHGARHLSPRGDDNVATKANRSLEVTSLILNALNSDQFALSSASIFENARAIEKAMERLVVPVGGCIITQGEKGDKFYVIESGYAQVEVDGKAVVSKSNKGAAILRRGHFFGEVALIFDDKRNATIRAVSAPEDEKPSNEVTCWALGRKDFKEIMAKCSMDTVRRLTGFFTAAKGTEAGKVLAGCTDFIISDMVSAMTAKSFNEGDLLCTKGEVGDWIYCLDKGLLQVEGDDAEVTSPGYFVGLELLSGTAPYKYEKSVMSGRFSSCYALPARSLRRMLGIKSVHTASADAVTSADQAQLKRMDKEKQQQRYRQNVQTLELGDLEEMAFLGRGAFGNVTLVQYTGDKLTGDGSASSTGRKNSRLVVTNKGGKPSVPRQMVKEPWRRFALKQMSKAQIVDNMLHHHALNEKRCLESLQHPCILSLYRTFQDDNALYMLTELCAGPELYNVVQRPKQGQGPNYPRPGLNQDTVQFYSACMLSALNFMDQKGIAHRDLKSENVLVNEDGYLKLIDWGFAKQIPYTMTDPETGEEYVNNKSFTMCGTPEYFAPEMILPVGCTRATDLWTYGIMVYEMYTGNTPFIDPKDPTNMKQMFVKVLSIDLEGPPFSKDFMHTYPEATEFISRCLRGDASLRASPHDLMGDPYLRHINWDKLENKTFPATWKPPSNYLQSARCTKKKNAIPEYDNNPDRWPEEDRDPFQHF